MSGVKAGRVHCTHPPYAGVRNESSDEADESEEGDDFRVARQALAARYLPGRAKPSDDWETMSAIRSFLEDQEPNVLAMCHWAVKAGEYDFLVAALQMVQKPLCIPADGISSVLDAGILDRLSTPLQLEIRIGDGPAESKAFCEQLKLLPSHRVQFVQFELGRDSAPEQIAASLKALPHMELSGVGISAAASPPETCCFLLTELAGHASLSHLRLTGKWGETTVTPLAQLLRCKKLEKLEVNGGHESCDTAYAALLAAGTGCMLQDLTACATDASHQISGPLFSKYGKDIRKLIETNTSIRKMRISPCSQSWEISHAALRNQFLEELTFFDDKRQINLGLTLEMQVNMHLASNRMRSLALTDNYRHAAATGAAHAAGRQVLGTNLPENVEELIGDFMAEGGLTLSQAHDYSLTNEAAHTYAGERARLAATITRQLRQRTSNVEEIGENMEVLEKALTADEMKEIVKNVGPYRPDLTNEDFAELPVRKEAPPVAGPLPAWMTHVIGTLRKNPDTGVAVLRQEMTDRRRKLSPDAMLKLRKAVSEALPGFPLETLKHLPTQQAGTRRGMKRPRGPEDPVEPREPD